MFSDSPASQRQWSLMASTYSGIVCQLGELAGHPRFNFGIVIRERQPPCWCSWGLWKLGLATTLCALFALGEDMWSVCLLWFQHKWQLLWVYLPPICLNSCVCAPLLDIFGPLCIWDERDFSCLLTVNNIKSPVGMDSTFLMWLVAFTELLDEQKRIKNGLAERSCD